MPVCVRMCVFWLTVELNGTKKSSHVAEVVQVAIHLFTQCMILLRHLSQLLCTQKQHSMSDCLMLQRNTVALSKILHQIKHAKTVCYNKLT